MKDLKYIKSFNEASENLNISDVIGSNNYTLYSACCSKEPYFRKKDDVEYYECPYCKEECEVEWQEDEFPDYCR
jgi:hypothetical protein